MINKKVNKSSINNILTCNENYGKNLKFDLTMTPLFLSEDKIPEVYKGQKFIISFNDQQPKNHLPLYSKNHTNLILKLNLNKQKKMLVMII